MSFIILLWCFTIVHATSLNYLTLPTDSRFDISKQCVLDVQRLNANLENRTTWAIEMYESSAKELTGLLNGNFLQFGSFDECLISKFPNEMKRQYCLMEIKLFSDDANIVTTERPDYSFARDVLLRKETEYKKGRNEIMAAICSPASCSVDDLKILLSDNKYLTQLSDEFNLTGTMTIDEKLCQTDTSNDPLTIGSILFLLSCGILITLVAVLTLYHHFETKGTVKKIDKRPCSEVVKAFSIYSNLKLLVAKDDKDLRIVYGLRVITTLTIMTIHTAGILALNPIINRETFETLTENIILSTTLQLGGTLVDTFFILGGFFAMYSLSRNFKNNNTLHCVVTRYVRLTPVYAFSIFYVATLLPQTGTGPQWHHVKNETEYCGKNWWTNLLFINNYVNNEEMCLIHSWYMPCDFHYYIISIFLCHLMSDPKREKLGLLITGSMLAISVFVSPAIIYHKELPPMLYFSNNFNKYKTHQDFFRYVYIKSHTRFSPYAFGLLTGYIYRKYYKKEAPKISTSYSCVIFLSALFVYFASSVTILSLIDIDGPYDPLKCAVFSGIYGPVKYISLCTMLLISIFGDVSKITWFLRCHVMIVLGKLTYGTYIISFVIQQRNIGNGHVPLHLSGFTMIIVNLWYYAISFFMSFFGYLFIEAPCNNLLKTYFKSKKKNPKKMIIADGEVKREDKLKINTT